LFVIFNFYSPAYWNGVAEKNGYILCVNVYGAAKAEEIRKYNYTNFSYNKDIQEKIVKLKQMTVSRGASEQEEQSAKMMIERLQKKAETEQVNKQKYIVVGNIPGHQAHPPKCNWHIEKDGVIIAKGNGILKYADVNEYYCYDSYMKEMQEFKIMSKEKYISKYMNDSRYNHSLNEEQERKTAESHYNSMVEAKKMMDQFEAFINKLDTTCGCLVGEGSLETYEQIKVTEYKKENKAIEITTGSIKDGQCFILKVGFNYGRSKGYVYRIHKTEYNDKVYYHAYKLNGKLTKECTGSANTANSWSYITDDFMKWINKGSIAWCEIQEVKTPYEVEKVVKKVINNESSEQQPTREKETIKQEKQETVTANNLHYEIIEDTDTRDNSKIYIVKVIEKLSHDEYITVNNNMKSIGGYYSRFKHGFIFKDNPTVLLNGETKPQELKTEETKQEEQIQQQPQQEAKKTIDFEIEQSQHTKTKENIWLVKIKSNLSKDDFAEVKRNFATLKGFYSSFNNSFIFKYDPTEKIKSA
jgi:hypothetical protein